MKKIVFLATIMFIIGGSSLVNNANACSVDGYVGPNGTSCIYKDSAGCFWKVTSHRFLFGLFKWNTEEMVTCDQSFAPF